MYDVGMVIENLVGVYHCTSKIVYWSAWNFDYYRFEGVNWSLDLLQCSWVQTYGTYIE